MAASPNSQDQSAPKGLSSSSYDNVKAIADFLLSQPDVNPPKIAIICGNGLNALIDNVVDSISFEYKDIPNFPICTVEGHVGRLIFGKIENAPVALMLGHFHFYEGYSVEKCAMPVRVLKLLGAEYLLVANAAAGINPNYKAGNLMILRDHINIMGMAGSSPLRGANDEHFGPRYPSLDDTYSPQIINKARTVVADMQINNIVHEGVYACVAGPHYETVAELKMLRTMGADAVGMSTAHEVVMAKHCDMKIFAFSLITYEGILDYNSEKKRIHENVMEIAKEKQPMCIEFVCKLIREIAKEFPVVCTCFD